MLRIATKVWWLVRLGGKSGIGVRPPGVFWASEAAILNTLAPTPS